MRAAGANCNGRSEACLPVANQTIKDTGGSLMLPPLVLIADRLRTCGRS